MTRVVLCAKKQNQCSKIYYLYPISVTDLFSHRPPNMSFHHETWHYLENIYMIIINSSELFETFYYSARIFLFGHMHVSSGAKVNFISFFCCFQRKALYNFKFFILLSLEDMFYQSKVSVKYNEHVILIQTFLCNPDYTPNQYTTM